MLPEKVNPKHVLGIDMLRFIAALLVVLFHFVFLTTVAPVSYSGDASGYLVKFPGGVAWSHFGWVGVQIFFVISGFVIAYSGERATPFSFFSSRLVRLGPGTWICATITLVFMLALDADASGHLRAHLHHFRNSVMFHPMGPWMDGTYWTLGVEISFYALVFVCIAIGRFMLLRPLVIVIGAVSTGFWLLSLAPGADSVQGLGQYLIPLQNSRIATLLLLQHGVFFALGVLLWLQLTKLPRFSNLAWGALFLAGGCLQVAHQAHHYYTQFNVGYTAAIPILIWLSSVALMVVSVRGNHVLHRLPQPVLRAMRTLGLMTFPLYLFHEYCGAAFMGWAAAAGNPAVVSLAFAVLVSMLVSYVIAKYLEPLVQAVTRHVLQRLHARWPKAARPLA